MSTSEKAVALRASAHRQQIVKQATQASRVVTSNVRLGYTYLRVLVRGK